MEDVEAAARQRVRQEPVAEFGVVEGEPVREAPETGAAPAVLVHLEVRVRGEVIAFTTREFELLQFLAEHAGLALSRQQILDGVWGYDWFGDERTVDVHLAQIRKKLDGAVRIDTVRGIGYRLEPS